MDQKKSPSARGRKKKSDPELKCSPPKKSPEKEFVEGSGIPKDQIEVGFKLMAASFDGKWYQGRIVEVDGNDNTFLVHFDFWNSRFDEWYKFTTKKVKPLEEEPYARKKHTPKFDVGDSVLAKWIDGKQYRGKIDKVKANDKYDVVFEDGVIYSTVVDMLKLGDKIDSNLEVERLTKQQEQFKRSRERENRSMRRSLEPGSTLPVFSSSLQDVHSITSVKYLNKIPRNLVLPVACPLKKVSLSYQTELSANTFTSRGKTFNVPNPALVFGSEDTSVRSPSPELRVSNEFSPRKRGRPKLHDTTTTPSKHLKSDFSPPKSKSPLKKSPNKIASKPLKARSPDSREERSTKSKLLSPSKSVSVFVQTDPVTVLTEHMTPVTSLRVDPVLPRPVPPSSHQSTPPLLQTETVLTSDGRWITIATPPSNQQPADLLPRPPAPNYYYQLVPMGANGPIQQPPPPLSIPPTQPQELLLTKPPSRQVMVLPQGQTLVQQPQALLQSPYIQQQRPIMQYQATGAGILQTQPASTVLVHTNTVPTIQQQHVIVPQAQSVTAQANIVAIAPPTQNPVIHADLASPPVAQRQTDPPSALQLASTAPLPVSPGPITSPSNSSVCAFPPVSSNLTASRTTIRLPEVQATASKETASLIPGEQAENGGLDTSSTLPTTNSLTSLSSRMPFSSLLSNAKQPTHFSPLTSQEVTSESEKNEAEIATIFAHSPPHSITHPNQNIVPSDPNSNPPTQVDAPVKLISPDNTSNQTNNQVQIQNDKTNLT